ncbi:hypothetical protein [Neptunicella sp.]|uniref:hypothetical protein n=1 Tax=Neptunicella sp. TaxID=2125986 RepID=UPI003F6942A0
MNKPLLSSALLVGFLCLSQAMAQTDKEAEQSVKQFYQQVMNAEALMPADLSDAFISCPVTHINNIDRQAQYKTSAQVDYQQTGWEQRISADWQYFSPNQQQGKVLVIDFGMTEKGLGYRYLANDNSQDQLYEPWSSSKIMAFTAAVGKAREQGVGAMSKAGETPLADLITSINSYAPFGQADGNSNGIATYFLNVAGRDRATALLHDDWLKLANPAIRFRGAYEVELFKPSVPVWQSLESANTANMPELFNNSDDPGYQSYRCDECGLTGNKPMTTLAQAEWLKRLASYERDAATRQPGLTAKDVEVLFYGTGHTDKNHQVGGMMQGISSMLQHALADAIAGKAVADPKTVLDNATNGQWRVWQKIGWGPSETRGMGENVVLAHVCLPGFQGGREFTVAAQAAYPGEDDSAVSHAGMKIQSILNSAMQKLLSPQQ